MHKRNGYYPNLLAQRGFIHFDEKQGDNDKGDPGTQIKALEAKIAELTAKLEKKSDKPAPEGKKEPVEPEWKSKVDGGKARVDKWLEMLDDEAWEYMVAQRGGKAATAKVDDKTVKRVAELERDKALSELADEHGLSGEAKKKFLKLLKHVPTDELPDSAKEIAETLNVKPQGGEDEEPAHDRLPTYGSGKSGDAEKDLETEFTRAYKREQAALGR